MSLHQSTASGMRNHSSKEWEKVTQFVFDNETQRLHRELKNELERIKIENKINKHISKILERRLTELNR